MANPACTTALLTEQDGVGQIALVENRRMYEAAMIYLKVLELAAIGGTDYRLTLTSTLVDDALALAKRMNPYQRKLARFNIARNNAIEAGASVSGISSMNPARECCLQAYQDLDSMLLLLDCKLGRHKAYPQ